MNLTRWQVASRIWATAIVGSLVGLTARSASAQKDADAAKDARAVVALEHAAANTWARIAWSSTGGREQPVFVYADNIGRFVMASGMQATGGVVPRHYDTEEFELATCKWTNAYPSALAKNRPVSGPVGEEYAKAREKIGYNGPEMFYLDGDFLRLGAGGQWLETRLGFESCYVPDNDKIYVYFQDVTLGYDPAKRTWEDLKAAPRTSCKLWGSMCYDPVNKEIVHAGGDGASYEVGTWVYSIADNQWRKLEFGSTSIKRLQDSAAKLGWQAKSLVGATSNRFTLSETPAESRLDLRQRAVELGEAADRIAEQLASADLKAAERTAAEVASQRLKSAAEAYRTLSGRLAETISPETIQAARTARERIEQSIDALASEPGGRARSQIAYAAEQQQIVMFGGDALEKVVADTWIYDCETRTWEQRFPKTCPLPRAGHVLGWLPQAKQIVLAGGYSRDWLAQEIWTYDLGKNEWMPLLHVPLAPEDHGRAKFSQNCPRVTARDNQVGAVAPDDTVVCLEASRGTLSTWACKVDPSQPAPLRDDVAVGTSGQYTWNQIDPADWEKVANPDAQRMKKFYADLPANQWTAIEFSKYAPGATNRWGTSAYDAKRHQILLWGGGHATSHENDVSHFSMLGGCWTVGYHPDDPIETVYASQPTPVSFANRPHVPIHAYRAYCYDSTADKMLYFDRAYDLSARQWESKPYPGLKHHGPMHSFMESTPHGAVTFSERGLFRFDATGSRWVKLDWDGPQPESIWCDGDDLLYDSKRDCLWLSISQDLYRYDFSTGKGEKLAVRLPRALDKFIFHTEAAYLPDADLILLMKWFRRSDGQWSNMVFDPAESKFYWAQLQVVGRDGKELKFDENPFGWDDALAYDPELKLVVLNSSHLRNVFVLRFNRQSAKLQEAGE